MAESAPSANISSAVLAETDIPALISKLHTFLPYPIPLYRRLQFHLKYPNPASARAFLALAAPINPQTWLRSVDLSSNDRTIPFLAVHIDLSYAGETQIYTFASWERPVASGDIPPTDEVKTALLNTLFKTLATDPIFIPSLPHSPPESHQLLMRTKKLVTPYSPSKVLFGALHNTAFALVPKHAHARTDPGFVKYIFPPSAAPTSDEPLPEGYRFGPIRTSDAYLRLVLSRTVIPRTLATLRQLGSVTVFYDGDSEPTVVEDGAEEQEQEQEQKPRAAAGDDARTAREIELGAGAVDARAVTAQLDEMARQPVAWGFLGKDASLSSLHVEPAHRGKGLAGAVTRRLFAMHDDVFGMGTGVGHADVYESNASSRRVMEKLGGESRWVVVWAELDMSKLVGSDGELLPHPQEENSDRREAE